ncbi:ferrous iron transport protein B [Agrilactobacillus composti DSM 18527 = JCM 14202]|nr:ferrous iron transport protein B [Agrilactobacillus composti DSM 18527 = JCM 14202]
MTNMEFALAGNPNSGKTTAFNALTGASQYVGNWPGVTVEKKGGYLKKDKSIVLQDLPGFIPWHLIPLKKSCSGLSD